MYVYLNGHLVPDAAATVSGLRPRLRLRRFPDRDPEDHQRPAGFFRRALSAAAAGHEAGGFSEPYSTPKGCCNQALSLAEANGVERRPPAHPAFTRDAGNRRRASIPVAELTPTLLLTAGAIRRVSRQSSTRRVPDASQWPPTGAAMRASNRRACLPTILARQGGSRGRRLGGDFHQRPRTAAGRFVHQHLFPCSADRLLTAGEDQPILPGITREKVIGIAEEHGHRSRATRRPSSVS